MVWGSMAERSLIQLNTNNKVSARSGVTGRPAARQYTVFLHFHGSAAILQKIFCCAKVLLARSMTRLHLEDHWVTLHLPGYSVVEGAHRGVARVLRCGLAADCQFVILVLKQFYHDNVEYYEVQIVCMYFYSRSALHCTLNKEITWIFGSLKKFKLSSPVPKPKSPRPSPNPVKPSQNQLQGDWGWH